MLDFLEQLMRLSASHPQKIPPTIQNVGQLLMNLLICATAGGLPYSRLSGVGDVLTTFLNDTCSGGQAPTWLQATLNAIPANALCVPPARPPPLLVQGYEWRVTRP